MILNKRDLKGMQNYWKEQRQSHHRELHKVINSALHKD